MSDSRTTSTLELAVNEQQQNMSQIDLRGNTTTQLADLGSKKENPFGVEHIKAWPGRVRASLSHKVDEAKSNSSGKTEFVLQLTRALAETLVWVLCFVGTVIVPVILFIAGLVKLDDCADRLAFPYCVLAMGFVMNVSNLFNLALSLELPVLTNQTVLSADLKNIIASVVNVLFNAVAAFLFVLCAYMVFTMGSNLPEEDSWPNCNHFLYGFTYWFIALTLSTILALALVAATLFCYNRYRIALVRGSTPRSEAPAG